MNLRVWLLLAALGLALLSPAAKAATTCSGNTSLTGDFSCTLSGSAQLILPDSRTGMTGTNAPHTRIFERVIVSAASGIFWCSRISSAAAVANGAGAFPLGNFGNAAGYPSVEEFNSLSSYVPQLPLWCTGTGALTAESY